MNPELKAIVDLLVMLVTDPRTGALIGLLLIAAWSDYRTGRIPNWVVLSGALAGLACNALLPQFHASAPAGFLIALAGLGCGLLALLPLYLLRVMGAGDVKLLAMTGAFLGYPDAVWGILASFLAGGVLSISYLVWKGTLRRALLNIVLMAQSAVLGGIADRSALSLDANKSAGTLPYGIAIAGGTIVYLVLRQFGLVQS